jgi:triosephosphate isomerase
MRKPLIAGNWKMNGSHSGNQQLLNEIIAGSKQLTNTELAVFPPFVYIAQAQQLLKETKISWGAQNFSYKDDGAYTGEISAKMLLDLDCRYVLIGHSERRTLYGETDKDVALKYSKAITVGLSPIICVGETLEEKNAGITHQIISCQLGAIFASEASIEGLKNAIIAYEPVWAIGTGLAASPIDAQEVHAMIREQVAEFDKGIAEQLRILYGGSVKPSNAAELFSMPDIDGGLIGGASLNSEEFLGIAKLCNS